MSKYLVYGLIDPRTLQVRYVGKSTTGLKRPKEHGQPSILKRKEHTHTSNWIKELRRYGLDYTITVLDITPEDKLTLKETEIWWIAYGRALGWDLTNHTNGGDGPEGWVPSEETRAKISQALKGKKLSPETRAKLSAARKGRVVSEATREKIRQSRLGKKHSADARAKMSAMVKAHYAVNGGRPQSPEEIEKRRKTLFGNKRAEGKTWGWSAESKERLVRWHRDKTGETV